MRGERGFTLVEVMVSIVIGAMLLTVLAGVVPALLRLSPGLGEKLEVEHDLSLAETWLSRDARSAQSFHPLSQPEYGAFEWEDYSAGNFYRAIYYYDPGRRELWRRLEENGQPKSSSAVAHLSRPEDLVFQWLPESRLIKVKLTCTARNHSRTAELILRLRPREVRP